MWTFFSKITGSTVVLNEFCSDSVSIFSATLSFSLKQQAEENLPVKGIVAWANRGQRYSDPIILGCLLEQSLIWHGARWAGSAILWCFSFLMIHLDGKLETSLMLMSFRALRAENGNIPLKKVLCNSERNGISLTCVITVRSHIYNVSKCFHSFASSTNYWKVFLLVNNSDIHSSFVECSAVATAKNTDAKHLLKPKSRGKKKFELPRIKGGERGLPLQYLLK